MVAAVAEIEVDKPTGAGFWILSEMNTKPTAPIHSFVGSRVGLSAEIPIGEQLEIALVARGRLVLSGRIWDHPPHIRV